MKKPHTLPRNDTVVIIPTFKSFSKTNYLLERLALQRPRNFDTVVVDSGESQDYLKIKGASKVLRFEEDLGGAGSFYHGLKYAYDTGYRKFILCDNDCIPIPKDAIQRIIENLDEADIVTPKTDSPEICFYHLVGMTRKVVDRVGYPRREFFMWMDEIEYSWRIKRAGFTERRIDIPFTHPEKGVFLNDPRAIYYCTRNGLYMLRDYNRYGKLIRFLIATVGINLLRGTMKYALMGISDFLLGKTGKKEYNFKNRAGKLEQRTQRLK